MSRDNWTQHDGKPVIWNKPPYYDPETGVLTLLLPGESKTVLEEMRTHLKRIQEYYLLTWRDSAKIREAKNEKGPQLTGEV